MTMHAGLEHEEGRVCGPFKVNDSSTHQKRLRKTINYNVFEEIRARYIFSKSAALPLYQHTYIHTYIHTYMHACMHACIHTHTHTYLIVCLQLSFTVHGMIILKWVLKK
jgi:hypothetical protein